MRGREEPQAGAPSVFFWYTIGVDEPVKKHEIEVPDVVHIIEGLV